MDKKSFSFSRLYLFVFLFICFTLTIGFSYTISYHGKLLDVNNSRVNGSVPVEFSLYNVSAGGTALWTESHNTVIITNGLFQVELGSINSIDLAFDEQYYLGININNSGELTPRTEIKASAYSFRAKYSDTAFQLADNTIAVGQLTINDTLIIGNNVFVTNDGKVGIGVGTPVAELEVSGTVKATAFQGDGANLTNVPLTNISGDVINRTEVKNLVDNILIDSIVTTIPLTKIEGDTITKSEVNTLLDIVGSDTSGLSNRLDKLESDSQNTESRMLNAESFINTITDTYYTETEVNSRLLTVSSDSTILNSRITKLEADSSHTENRLLNLESDSANSETRLTNIESDSENTETRLTKLEADSENTEVRIQGAEGFINTITDTYYTELEINALLNSVSTDTTGLTGRIMNLEADSTHTENRLLNLEFDSSHTESRLLNLESDSILTETRLVNLESDSVHTENRLTNLESDSENTETRLVDIEAKYVNKTTLNDSFSLKSNLSKPIFTGTVTADSLIINDTGLIVSNTGNIAIGDGISVAKLVIKGNGSDSTTTVLLIKNGSGTTLFYINDSGNIGVGTSTPTEKLEVNGAIKALNTNNKVYAVFAP